MVVAGILRIGNAGALNFDGFNSVAIGPTGTLALCGNSVTISALRTNFFVLGSPVVQNGSATAATLTVYNNAPSPYSTYGGVLQDGPGGGALALVKNGTGTLILSGSKSYSGGTTVVNGDLSTTSSGTLGASEGPLTISAAKGVTSALSLGNNQTIGQLAGTVAAGGSATIYVAAGTTLTVNQSSQSTFAGTLTNSGTVAMSSSGGALLELTGAPTFFSTSALSITGGTLRFKVSSGIATIGAGVTAAATDAATLELAGSVSALGSAAGNRVNVNNTSTADVGLLASGTHQVVGNIDGSGTTQVNASSDLTANHIIQGALVIGSTTGSPALVTIDASDASGNPLGQASGFALAGSLTPNAPFGSAGINSANLNAGGGSLANGSTLGGGTPGSTLNSSAAAVPEPATLLLALLGLAAIGCLPRHK
jgi:fibronectin-binding autotransporter adhesin